MYLKKTATPENTGNLPTGVVQTSGTASSVWAAYWRKHLHLLIAVALVPIFFAIYYLCFWLRFEGQLGWHELESFRATVGWVVCVKLAWFVGLRVCRGLEPIGDFLRSERIVARCHRRCNHRGIDLLFVSSLRRSFHAAC